MKTEFEAAASNVETSFKTICASMKPNSTTRGISGTSVSPSIAGGALEDVSNSPWQSQHATRQAPETQELARQADRHAQLVQAGHHAPHARAIGCGARGAAYAGQHASSDAVFLMITNDNP